MMPEGDTLARAIEEGIGPEFFFVAEHAAIFAAMRDARAKGLAVDVAIVGETLKASGQLEAAGGYNRLALISSAVNTEAGASNWIDRVLELAHSRRVLTLSQIAVDRCATGESSALDLLEPFIALHETASVSSSVLRKKVEAEKLTDATDLPPLRIVYRIKGTTVGTPGNILAITGKPKAGKSAFEGAMLAATMKGENDGDCLGVTSENPSGLAVIHLDSEQDKHSHRENLKTVLKRAGLSELPKWFRSYSVIRLSVAERNRALRLLMTRAKAELGGVHSVHLDGLADFVLDPNDPSCFGFVDGLQALAGEFDCVIVCVLHINPTSETFKTRGHLGSQLARRSETNLVVEREADSGRVVVWSEQQRRAPIPKADGPCFRWDEASQMHVSVETMRSEKEATERENLTEIAHECYADCPSRRMKYSALVERVKTVLKCVESTGAQKISRMRKLSIIKDVPPRLLELAA
jgi:hypothetical protein